VKNKILIISIALTVILLGWAVALLFLVSPGQQALRDQVSFADHVVKVLQAKYPARRFATEQEGTVLRAGAARLPLDKLYQQLEIQHVTGDDVDKRILGHFDAIFNPKEVKLAPIQTPPWSEAAKKALPRLVTPAYGQKQNLVRDDLVPGVQVAYTVGQQKNVLLLVTPDDLQTWKIDAAALRQTALANLTALSRNVRLAGPPAPEPGVRGRWIGVAVRDGHDAARILLPEVRRQVAAVIGEPFFVGVPNNGFLVAWSRDFNRGKLWAQQTRADFEGRQEVAAVSPEIFMATVKDGLRPATAAEIAALEALPQAPPPPPPPQGQAPPAPAPGAARP
jgi:hypothetical protein